MVKIREAYLVKREAQTGSKDDRRFTNDEVCLLLWPLKIARFAGFFQEWQAAFRIEPNKEAEERPLPCGDDEGVVLDPDGFNLGWKLEFVSILG